MSDRVTALYRQQVILEGVLGAAMMVSLVLVLQSGTKFEFQVLGFPKDWYFDGLAALMAITSLLLIFASWGMGYVAAGVTSEEGIKARRFRRVMLFFYRLGLTLVLAVVAALLLPSTIAGAAAALVLGGILLAVFDELRLRALREAQQELRQRVQEAQQDEATP